MKQRVLGIALGYEDLNDHDELCRDSVLALLSGCSDMTGSGRVRLSDRGKPLAGKSTLNRLELTPAGEAGLKHRYKQVVADFVAMDALLVEVFLESYETAPEEIILDVDATDDPVHGHQAGPLFSRVLPALLLSALVYLLLVSSCCAPACGRRTGTGRRARSRNWHVLLSAFGCGGLRCALSCAGDGGFCREALMSWCEGQGVEYVLGLAKNPRLKALIAEELQQAKAEYESSGEAARVFRECRYQTLESWSRERRVVGKAEHLGKGANPRFIVSSLPSEEYDARTLYEDLYCARGDMENRIKEQQLALFADRTSTHEMHANQLRLYFSSFAYVLMQTLRRLALQGTGPGEGAMRHDPPETAQGGRAGTYQRAQGLVGVCRELSVCGVVPAGPDPAPGDSTTLLARQACRESAGR